MAAPLFVLILFTTESGFRSYVYQGDIQKAMAFAPLLEREFEGKGSWEAVGPLLSQAPFAFHSTPLSDSPESSIHSDGPFQDFDWIQERIVILDTARKVAVDSKHVLVGTIHSVEHVADSVLLKNREGWTIGYLLVGTMVDPALTQNHEGYLSSLALSLVFLFIVSLCLVLPLAFWLGSRIARPLRTLVEGTQRATPGDWDWTLPEGTPREVQVLSEAFQKLGANLQTSEDRKAQMLADAAHELRTPLTVVRGTLEAMIEGIFPLETKTLEAVYSETLRLEKIVDSLRQLEDLHARPAQPASFSWKDLVGQVVGLFRSQALEKKQSLEWGGPEELLGWGEPEAIQQILVNLVSNALRHAPQEGLVVIGIGVSGQGSLLSVEDNGPGIPEEARERVFERFVRLDTSRSEKTGGRGLGLAIVRQLVQRHGGSIRVVAGRQGGARFEVWFPSNPRNL
jgi:two-component system OmpR family sensor kinase/two-component system sensor histidine kinase BaeS